MNKYKKIKIGYGTSVFIFIISLFELISFVSSRLNKGDLFLGFFALAVGILNNYLVKKSNSNKNANVAVLVIGILLTLTTLTGIFDIVHYVKVSKNNKIDPLSGKKGFDPIEFKTHLQNNYSKKFLDNHDGNSFNYTVSMTDYFKGRINSPFRSYPVVMRIEIMTVLDQFSLTVDFAIEKQIKNLAKSMAALMELQKALDDEFGVTFGQLNNGQYIIHLNTTRIGLTYQSSLYEELANIVSNAIANDKKTNNKATTALNNIY